MSDDSLRSYAEQRVGKVIKGKYRVDKVLGMGGMAVVYAVTHQRNNAELALKMLHPELSIRDDIRQRFLREGYAGNSVKHPSVVMVVDDETSEDGAAFIVMERLHGEPVDAIWEKHDSRLEVPAAVALVDQLLDVLRAAHEKGIVHRDIKPANLFLTREGTVKVLDFGIARVRDALASSGAQQTGSGVLMGTPAFMSPEQALAKSSEIDAQSDVWAAGATLYTLISGHYVHEADNGAQMLVKAATAPAPSLALVAPNVPQPIVDVVARALAFDKAVRYPSAAAMREALREAHRAVFGAVPSRAALESLFHEVGHAATQLGSHAAIPLAAPVARAVTPGGTTSQPVASEPLPLQTRTSSSRAPLFAAGGLAALLLVGAGVMIGKSRTNGHAADPTSVATAASTTPSPSLAMSAAAPAVTPSATAAAPSVVAPPIHTAFTSPSASVKPGARASAKPTASAAPSAAPPKTNCEPPYFFDAQGKKQWKAECL